MRLFECQCIKSIDLKRLSEAKLQLVSAARWLACIEHSYVRSIDCEDFFLCWRYERGVICTHKIAADIGLELHVGDLVMQFTQDDVPTDHKLDVEERSPAQAEAWILGELLHRGIDRRQFSKDLPYDTTDLMSGDAVEFSPSEYEAELEILANWFKDATHTMESVVSQLAPAQKITSFRISPQTLCIEITISNYVCGFSLGSDKNWVDPNFYAVQAVGEMLSPSKKTLRVSEIQEKEKTDRLRELFSTFQSPTEDSLET